MDAVDPTVFRLAIFVLAIFVGYYVVWSVTPALHTPLMAVTNAISSVIIVGELIAAAASGSPSAKWLGLLGVVLASVNIFGLKSNGGRKGAVQAIRRVARGSSENTAQLMRISAGIRN